MDNLQKLIKFLEKLEEDRIYFKLDKIRDSILVEVYLPGYRWEVEFMAEGQIELERFKSDSDVCSECDLEAVYKLLELD